MIGLIPGLCAASNPASKQLLRSAKTLRNSHSFTTLLTFQYPLFQPKLSKTIHPSRLQFTRSKPRRSATLSLAHQPGSTAACIVTTEVASIQAGETSDTNTSSRPLCFRRVQHTLLPASVVHTLHQTPAATHAASRFSACPSRWTLTSPFFHTADRRAIFPPERTQMEWPIGTLPLLTGKSFLQHPFVS